MANIFTLENIDDFSEKLNIDELYEKKRQYDLNKLTLFNKILNRIHVRIKTTSKQKMDEQFCWFIVPEIILGVPKYDQGACIAFLLEKLKNNGFNVRYVHPNALFISWHHFIPSYVRTELKKKTGIVIDEYGKKIEQIDNGEVNEERKISEAYPMFNIKETNLSSVKNTHTQKKYTPIQSYKPSGNLVYNQSLINTLEDKFS